MSSRWILIISIPLWRVWWDRDKERERARKSDVTALRLQENCDDHAEKKNQQETYIHCLCTPYEFLLKKQGANGTITNLDSEIHPQAPSNHSRSCAGILELIEMCKIRNRIDRWKWKSSVNISPEGRRRRSLSCSVFAGMVWSRQGCLRLWVGDLQKQQLTQPTKTCTPNPTWQNPAAKYNTLGWDGGQIIVALIYKKLTIKHTWGDNRVVIGTGVIDAPCMCVLSPALPFHR